MNHALTAENLSIGFAGRQVLEHVTFEVQEGEIFGLLGPSGAGKTTLIKILTGRLFQEDGYAKLLGKDTKELGASEHGQIGVMMDDFGLYERMSAYDNLSFYAELYHVPKSRIDDILGRMGLYDARRRAVSKLSKGMRNRLSLARALMNQAKLLFLDEPTSGLDPVTTRDMHAVLTEQKKMGTTIFLTTHNMYEAQNLCDRVALLSGGRIIECGKPAAICKKYNYLNRFQITLKNGNVVTLDNNSDSAIPIKEYLEQDAIETIHSTEPTLESVFIELTGKGLRSYE